MQPDWKGRSGLTSKNVHPHDNEGDDDDDGDDDNGLNAVNFSPLHWTLLP